MNITAPTPKKAAVVPAHPAAADNVIDNSTGEDDKERALPSLAISPTIFSIGDRIRTKATNFDDDDAEDGEPFSVTHAAQGNGIWVNGTIKYVFSTKGPQGLEQTYKALFDGDKVQTKTWHSHIEAVPKEADSSSSSDSDEAAKLKDLGVGSDTDVPEGDKQRRSSTRKTLANSNPNKDKPSPKKKKTLKPKTQAATKDQLAPKKKSQAPKDPPETPDEDENINGTYPSNHPFATSVELSFVSLIAIVLFYNWNFKLQL